MYFKRNENNPTNEIIRNLQTIIRKHFSLFSNDNTFQSLRRHVSQLLIRFQIQSNRLSAQMHQPGEQTVPGMYVDDS